MQSIQSLKQAPGLLIFGWWEFLLAWGSTRRWGMVILFALLPCCALGFMCIASFVGRWQGSEALVERYWLLIDERMKEFDESEIMEGSFQGDSIDHVTELMLERVLQEDFSSRRANFLIAMQLGARGRFGQARTMMRAIAPENGHGLAPAHAWLALDRMTRLGVDKQADLNVLLNDFKWASEWESLNPAMLVQYAKLLNSQQNHAEAIAALRQAALRDPNYWISVAVLAKQLGLSGRYEQAAAEIRSELQPKVAAQVAEPLEYARLARLALLDEDFREARQLTELGLRKDPQHADLRRILSEVYLLQYRQTADYEKQQFNIDLLDAALKADGSNEGVTEEVARLVAQGQDASPELRKMLEEKLATGKATALTHLLLANRDLLNSDMEQALGHLRVAVRSSPNSPVILNNLGLAIVRREAPTAEELKEAEAALRRALSVAGPNAELLDSLGEILLAAGKYTDAIQTLEAAIGMDENRDNTRQRLIQAYQAAGMRDMVEVQQRVLDSRSSESTENGNVEEADADADTAVPPSSPDNAGENSSN